MLSEAKQFWDAISGKIKSLIKQETANTFRCERYEVTTAPNGTVIGVTKAFGEKEILLPYSKEVELAIVGQPVLVVWWGSMSNAKVYYYANGYDGASGGGGGGNEIYIGTDTPPAGAKVWINPNGDPDSIGNTDLYRGNKVSSGNITLADEYTNYDLLVITWITNVDVYTQILDTKDIVSTRNYFTDFAASNAVNGLLSTAYIKFPNTTTVNIGQVTYNNVNWSLGILSIVGVTVSNPDLSVLKVRNPDTASWDAIPTIQGRDGPQGPQGDSGVYYGTDTPPEGTKVWIDPSGSADVLPEWNLAGTVTSTSSVITYPETAKEIFIKVRFSGYIMSNVFPVVGIQDATVLLLGGYYYSSSDTGLVNVNHSATNRTVQVRNAKYGSTSFTSMSLYWR